MNEKAFSAAIVVTLVTALGSSCSPGDTSIYARCAAESPGSLAADVRAEGGVSIKVGSTVLDTTLLLTPALQPSGSGLWDLTMTGCGWEDDQAAWLIAADLSFPGEIHAGQTPVDAQAGIVSLTEPAFIGAVRHRFAGDDRTLAFQRGGKGKVTLTRYEVDKQKLQLNGTVLADEDSTPIEFDVDITWSDEVLCTEDEQSFCKETCDPGGETYAFCKIE